jgi:hypothetical protein
MAAKDDGEMGILDALGAGDAEPDADDMEEMHPKQRAIQDFFDAGNSGDMTGAAEAFQRAYDICAARKSSNGASEKPAVKEYELGD